MFSGTIRLLSTMTVLPDHAEGDPGRNNTDRLSPCSISKAICSQSSKRATTGLKPAASSSFEDALRRVALDRDVRLVFLAEPDAEQAAEALENLRRRSTAAVLPLPLVPSDRHPSLEQMRRLVEQATGASLI